MTGDWFSCGAYCWQNAAGYRIAAFRVGGGYRYSLFAPPLGERAHEERLKARYARGERVPQQRELLGCFDDPAAARAAAARHQSTQPAQGGDHGNADSDQRQSETETPTGDGERRGSEVEAAA